MQFPFRDLTNQYISLSYHDVVQRYTQGTASYFLDGLGNVILFVPTSSIGQQVLTSDQAVTSASHAVMADTASLTIYTQQVVSASWASRSYTSETSSYTQKASIASYALASEYAQFTATASSAISALTSVQAEVADIALTASLSEFSENSNFAISASYAFSASWAPIPQVSDSASWASSSISASYSVTASTLSGFNFINTGSWISILNTDTPIVQVETGSYDAAFFDYVALSGSNTRAGMVFGSWVNGQINYTEVSNVDIGDTSKVTMSLALAGNVVQLVANVTDTTPWKVKALARYL